MCGSNYFCQGLGTGFSFVFRLLVMPINLLYYGETGFFDSERKYVPIIESKRTDPFFTYEYNQLPAIGETFTAEGLGSATTDYNGMLVFHSRPEKFNNGLRLYHESSGTTYIIRREKHTRSYKASWHPAAKIANDVISASGTIIKVYRMSSIVAGPAAISGAIVTDLIRGVILGVIIDKVATKTEEYYQWSIIRSPTFKEQVQQQRLRLGFYNPDISWVCC